MQNNRKIKAGNAPRDADQAVGISFDCGLAAASWFGCSCARSRGDLRKDRANASGDAGHNRPRRDGNEPGHQCILDQVLRMLVSPDPEAQQAVYNSVHGSMITERKGTNKMTSGLRWIG